MSIIRASNTAVRTAGYLHVQQLLFGTPLACTENRVDQIIAAIGPRLLGLSTEGAVEVRADLFGPTLPEDDDIEVTPEGVAIVPIRGTLTRRAAPMQALSGITSYEQIVGLIERTAGRSGVRAQVLAFDTPGGGVAGMLEAASAIGAVGVDMPLFGVVDGLTASAGYPLIAQTERIFIGKGDITGSLGVFAVRLDATAADKAEGLSYRFVRHGDRKGDGNPHKATSKPEMDDLQRQVDDATALMFEAIVEARSKLTLEAIENQGAAVFTGQRAVDVGLADAVGGVGDAVRVMVTRLGDRRGFAVVPRVATGLAHEPGASSVTTNAIETATERRNAMGDETDKKNEPEKPAPTALAPAEPTEASATHGKVIPIDAAVAKKIADEAVTAAKQENTEIIALCEDFGVPERAGEFINASFTRRQAFEKLQEKATAEDAERETRGTHGPRGTGTKQLDPEKYEKHWNDAMAAAQATRAPVTFVG